MLFFIFPILPYLIYMNKLIIHWISCFLDISKYISTVDRNTKKFH